MRLAAKDSSRSGRLIRLAITIEPRTVATSAIASQTSQVLRVSGAFGPDGVAIQ